MVDQALPDWQFSVMFGAYPPETWPIRVYFVGGASPDGASMAELRAMVDGKGSADQLIKAFDVWARRSGLQRRDQFIGSDHTFPLGAASVIFQPEPKGGT